MMNMEINCFEWNNCGNVTNIIFFNFYSNIIIQMNHIGIFIFIVYDKNNV